MATDYESTQTQGDALLRELEGLRETQVNYKKTSGWFATKDQVERIENAVHKLMESGETRKSPTQLIEMQSIIDDLRQRASRAEEALKASRANEATTKVDLATAKERFAAAERESARAKAEITKEQQEARSELKSLRQKLKEATTQASDPDRVQDLKDQVHSLQAMLQELNAKYKVELAGVQNWRSRVKELEAEVELEKAKRERFRGATFGPDLQKAPPEPMGDLEFDPSRDSAILKRVLSADSLEMIKQAAEAKRASTREYAYQLMQLANHRDPRNFVGYKEYTKAIFEKVRKAGARKRDQYLPLLDKTWQSMAEQHGPKLKEVKKEFHDFFDTTPIQKEKEAQVISTGNPSWWQSLKFDLWMARAKARVAFKETKARAAGLRKYINWPSLPKWLKVPSLKSIFWWSSA